MNASGSSVEKTPLICRFRSAGVVISIGFEVYRLYSAATRSSGSWLKAICRCSQAVVRRASTATGVAGPSPAVTRICWSALSSTNRGEWF